MNPNTSVQVELPQYLAASLYAFVRANRDACVEFMQAQEHVDFGDEAVDTLEMELCDAAEIEWTEPE